MFTKPHPVVDPVRSEPVQREMDEPAPEARPSPRHGGPSLISADVVIVGSLTTEGDVDLNGSIEGDVSANVLTIGKSGRIIGQVRARSVTVSGVVEGGICADTIHLRAGAAVCGEMHQSSLTIEAGAAFEGSVNRAPPPAGAAIARAATPKAWVGRPTSLENDRKSEAEFDRMIMSNFSSTRPVGSA